MSDGPEARDDASTIEADRQAWLAERAAKEQERATRARRRNKILASVAGGVTLLGGGLLVGKSLGSEGSSTPQPEVIPPSSGTSVSPGAELPSKTPETSSSGIQTIEQVASMETMDAMSIEEFAQLPYADRAAYAYMKVPGLQSATPEEAFNPAAVVGLYWQELSQTAVGMEDTTVGAKISSANNYYTTDLQTGEISDTFQTEVDSILATGGAGVGITTSLGHVDNGETQLGEDRDGNEIEFTNITYEITDRQTGEFISEHTSQVFQFKLELQDGRTVVVYPQGYGTEGHQSPLEDYPY